MEFWTPEYKAQLQQKYLQSTNEELSADEQVVWNPDAQVKFVFFSDIKYHTTYDIMLLHWEKELKKQYNNGKNPILLTAQAVKTLYTYKGEIEVNKVFVFVVWHGIYGKWYECLNRPKKLDPNKPVRMQFIRHNIKRWNILQLQQENEQNIS